MVVAAVTDRWAVTPYADGRGRTVGVRVRRQGGSATEPLSDRPPPHRGAHDEAPGRTEPPGGLVRDGTAGQTVSGTAFASAGSLPPSDGASDAFGPAPLSGTSLTKTAATRASTATTEPSRNAPWVPADTACW